VRGEHGERFPQDISAKERQVEPSMVWMITAGHLDGKFHREKVAESDPMLHF